jgi:hypothetical protein
MRKLLLTGLLAAALCGAAMFVGCDRGNPVGPGGPGTVTVLQTTTTTTVVPTNVTRRYVGFQVQPNVPSDMTLFFTLVSGGSSVSSLTSLSSLFRNTFIHPQDAGSSYSVFGVYRTNNGVGGEVRGSLSGSLDNGTFTGTLTANLQGCMALRMFSGSVGQILQWTGGSTLQDCPGSPLAFSGFTLLKTDAPPPTTTVGSSTSTTSSTTTSSITCPYTLSSSNDSQGIGGGPGQVDLITNIGCTWTVQSFASWITVLTPLQGAGPTTVRYSVAPNGSGARRDGGLVIAGIAFVVTQAGP